MDENINFPEDFPVNVLVELPDGELLLRTTQEYAELAIATALADEHFTVSYYDEQTLIAVADDGSVGAWARYPSGDWGARMNITDEEDKNGMLDLAARMSAAKDAQQYGFPPKPIL